MSRGPAPREENELRAHRFTRIALTLATTVAAIATTLVGGGAPASAQTTTPCYPIAVNSHYVWSEETYPGSANWSVSGWGPATLAMTKTVTVTNTFTSTVSISASVVTGAVGFNVAWSAAVGTSYTLSVPANEEYTIEAGYVSLVYQFDVEQICSGKAIKAGTGWAYQYNHLVYNWYRNT